MLRERLIKTLYLASTAYLSMVVGLYIFNSAWLAFAIYHGLILCVMLHPKSRPFLSGIFAGLRWGPALAVIVFGLSGGVVLYLLAPIAGISAGSMNPVLSRFGLTGWPWLAFILYHTFVNPFFEEIFWRGRLGSSSRKLIMTDFLFAGYHILVLVWFLEPGFIVLSFCILVLTGWLWRQLRQSYGGLILSIISHMAADGSIMFAAYFLSVQGK